MTTNIKVASPTFIRLVLGVANDCKMPHFTPITLASCLFSPESFVAIFVGRSKSILCKLGFDPQIYFTHRCSTIVPLETHIPTQKQTSLPFIFNPRLSECNRCIHNSKESNQTSGYLIRFTLYVWARWLKRQGA